MVAETLETIPGRNHQDSQWQEWPTTCEEGGFETVSGRSMMFITLSPADGHRSPEDFRVWAPIHDHTCQTSRSYGGVSPTPICRLPSVWLEYPHTARQQPAYCLKAHAFNTNRFFPLHNLQRLDTSYYDQSLQDTRIDSMGSPQALGCWCALRSWEQIAVFVSVGGNHFHGMNPKQMEKWHPIDLLTTFLFFIGVTIYIYRYSTIIVFREHW